MEGDAVEPQAVTLEDTPRVRDDQESLAMFFRNERDRVLLLPERDRECGIPHLQRLRLIGCSRQDMGECVGTDG